MNSSLGFGSIAYYYIRPIQTRFRYGSVLTKLNLAIYNNSLAHYAKGTWSHIRMLCFHRL